MLETEEAVGAGVTVAGTEVGAGDTVGVVHAAMNVVKRIPLRSHP